MRLLLIPAASIASVCLAAPASAQTIVATPVPGFFDRPSVLTAPIGDDRLFVVESRRGRVLVVDDTGTTLATPYLDLGPLTTVNVTQGLLGLAFHPRYAENGYVFVYYTDDVGDTVLDRYTVSATDANVVDTATRVEVLKVAQPFTDNNGGGLIFGPDGYLYLGLGDGGGVLDPFCSAQDLNTLLGKILRLDIDAVDTTGTYAVPPTNPFVGASGASPEIWHYGFSQPWRFSFDRRDGTLWIGEVGENTVEEVNRVDPFQGGWNFGWQVVEGDQCTADFAQSFCAAPVPDCANLNYTSPFFEYPHDFSVWGCAIMGGFVYDGAAIPDLVGTYLFADHCTSRVWSIDADASGAPVVTDRTVELFGAAPPSSITSFGRDGFGELYVLDLAGLVRRIDPASGTPAAPEPLTAFGQALDITDGGLQHLLLDAGPAHAGENYFILGSITGTTPGIPVDGLLLPLNFDGYLQITLNQPNGAFLPQSLAPLDADGRAQALFVAGPGALPLATAGLTVHHAFVTLDPLSLPPVTFASNAVSLELH